MTRKVYGFKTELAKGTIGERITDDYFKTWYWIVDVSMDKQLIGIDREYTDMLTGKRWRFQIKTDWKSQNTGNLIFETVSKDAPYTPGWAYTCQADVLIYFRYYIGEMIAIEPRRIRQELPDWLETYPEAKMKNERWITHGLKVPVNEARRISYWQDHMPLDYLNEDHNEN